MRLELSWGCDNTLLLIKSNILQTIPSQPNQTKPNSDVFGPINIQECIVTSTKSYQPRQVSLDFDFEFLGAATAYYDAATAYSGAATAYAAQPQLILWCKPIFVSNPTQVEGSVEVGVEFGL